MKHFIFFLTIIFSSSQLKSQCFEIQSILVDACDGPNEGKNEMVTFQVGSAPLLTTNLSVNWPANSWLGLLKNAGTAANVATINSTIMGCGFLKEPTANVLPANAKVLLVTSTAWNPLAQSFVNLNDTLYIIFQTAGNTGGHFANYQAGGGLRTLTMSFSSPSGCSDVVTYDRAFLINQAGNIGAQDGGAVEFTASGTPSYVNHGCQAPFIPLSLDAGLNKTICIGSSQNFTATASGGYTSVNWSLGNGASGSFSPSNSLTTTYTPDVSDNGTIKLYCTIIKTCGLQTTTVKDSVNLTITPIPSLTVSPSVVSICSGQSATVNAVANTAVTYTWSTGVNTSSVSLSSAGVFSCNVSNACGNTSETVTVTVGTFLSTTASATQTLLCSGQTTTLSTSGIGNYLWSNGATTQTTSVSNSGVYSVTLTNSCGSAVSSITISSQVTPTVSISSSSSTICAGQSSTITANSNVSNYSWSTGSFTNTTVVNTSGIVTVTVSNSCGVATASTIVFSNTLPILNLTSSSATICPNETATLTVTGGSAPYSWSHTSNTGSVVTTSGGVITVSITNACGTTTATAIVTIANLNADVIANPTSGVLPLVVSFTNNSSNANSYAWNFGNGNSATTSTVSSETYSVAGTYTVYLIATNGACSDVDSLIIKVLNQEGALVIPNVFTPNGDSINDVFRVTGFNIIEFNCTIFDRWGLQMYLWNDIKNGWNGKTNDKDVPAGTYFYMINAKDIDGIEVKKQGAFSLFR